MSRTPLFAHLDCKAVKNPQKRIVVASLWEGSQGEGFQQLLQRSLR